MDYLILINIFDIISKKENIMKKLVAYFSATGTTRDVAKKIAKEWGADLFEIEPLKKYTYEDLNWRNKQSRSTIEMENKSFRPPIAHRFKDMPDYDEVVIGFPVWWYTAPTIINTFIDNHFLGRKKLYVFVTSGGSDAEGSFNDLKKVYDDLNFVSCKRFTGKEKGAELVDWLK